ncbi:stabilin-2-like, partial [Saccoglossus kowalevskii]
MTTIVVATTSQQNLVTRNVFSVHQLPTQMHARSLGCNPPRPRRTALIPSLPRQVSIAWLVAGTSVKILLTWLNAAQDTGDLNAKLAPVASSDPCSGKGTCFDRITGNGTCMCNSGFAGEQCERCAQENMYGPNCDIECECVYGVCHDTDGFCLCLPGYHGDKCDQPSPECSSMNCPAHSHCVVLEGASRDYTCDCDDGYQVTETNDALTCIEIDPCSLSVDCDINADCVPIGPNHYNCSCTTGYSGDGYFCRPINPCSNSYGGCPTNTTYCIYDGPGQYHCQCKWGYENLVENQGCTLVDICVTDSNCHGNADCVMIRAFEPKCTCKEGFLGDGVNCYGNILQQLLDLNSDHLGPLQGKLSRAYFAFQQSYGSVLANSGPFTVFVPNEDAFNKADPTLMSSANSDADFSHYLFGLHIIPTVLNGHQLNTSDEIYTLTGMPGEVTFSDRKSILELIAKEGLFNRLEAMIQEAALDTVIHDTEGPFTVFAPNNNAFDSLQHGALDYFASPEGKPKLVQLLKNHIISGFMLTSSDLLITERVTTMQSTTLSIAPNSL